MQKAVIRIFLFGIFLGFCLLYGCENNNKTEEGWLSATTIKVCIDGIIYYQFTSGGAVVAYNPDGTLKLCK